MADHGARRFARRRIRVFGIGAPKSGTHSLAGVFAANYRTAHEPEAHDLVRLLVGVADGTATDADLRAWLRGRERRLRLEVNSAGLNGLVVEQLVDLVPSARFILTIREPASWLNSLVNHSVERDPPAHYQRLRDLRFDATRVHPPEERPLAERGLYTVDGYLASWTERNQRALDAVPTERLLVVRTDELATELDAIADFVGVGVDTLDATQAHQYVAPTDHGVVDELPPGYVAAKVNEHCRPLTDRFFS